MPYTSLFQELSHEKTTATGASALLHVSGLSLEQHEAYASPLSESAVICAGAGAGKTKLLAERVSRLLKSGVDPKKIAVVTFTRKSADEILARVRSRVGLGKVLPFCGTVHSLAYALLRKRGVALNLLADDELVSVVQELKPLFPDDIQALSHKEFLLVTGRKREQEDYTGVVGLCALALENALKSKGQHDFTSLLSIAAEDSTAVFDYILVDEAQDLSDVQLRLLRTIGPSAKFWYIGDADQAIYAFRGSRASMMHELNSQCEGFYPLTLNYRSAVDIVSRANNLVVRNANRFALSWTPFRTEKGHVEVASFDTGEEELAAAEDWLRDKPLSRCVLSRVQSLIAPLKEKGLQACSVHESKGLEWPEVWVLGCESALFPHPLSGRDEERRLFYVAMTRAKNRLKLTYSNTRRSGKTNAYTSRSPSPFLLESQGFA